MCRLSRLEDACSRGRIVERGGTRARENGGLGIMLPRTHSGCLFCGGGLAIPCFSDALPCPPVIFVSIQIRGKLNISETCSHKVPIDIRPAFRPFLCMRSSGESRARNSPLIIPTAAASRYRSAPPWALQNKGLVNVQDHTPRQPFFEQYPVAGSWLFKTILQR